MNATVQMLLGLFCYGLILLFGVAVSAAFTTERRSRRDLIALVIFSIFAILLQLVSWLIFGLERTKQLYPLIVHLPLVIFLATCFQRPWFQAVTGVCSAYLCLQIPRWISLVVQAIFQAIPAYYITYIPAIFLTHYALRRYVAGPVFRLTSQSTKSCLLLGTVPLFYYLFDYSTTVYTQWLYTGAVVAVQFIPSVVAMFYFVFVVIYYGETQKQAATQRERDQMEAQFKQAKTALDALRQSEEQTRRYRHDMRHHFSLLQALAAEGDVAQIADYLHAAQSDLDSFTPTRYCENETANLLLSSFQAKAAQAGVTLTVEANLPVDLPLCTTELCSLLSNSLENAITAAAKVSAPIKKAVALRAAVYQEKLLLSVENPYVGEIVLKDGLPQSTREGHGYGTRSIAAIAQAHGGHALFTARDGVFALKVMLPLERKA